MNNFFYNMIYKDVDTNPLQSIDLNFEKQNDIGENLQNLNIKLSNSNQDYIIVNNCNIIENKDNVIKVVANNSKKCNIDLCVPNNLNMHLPSGIKKIIINFNDVQNKKIIYLDKMPISLKECFSIFLIDSFINFDENKFKENSKLKLNNINNNIMINYSNRDSENLFLEISKNQENNKVKVMYLDGNINVKVHENEKIIFITGKNFYGNIYIIPDKLNKELNKVYILDNNMSTSNNLEQNLNDSIIFCNESIFNECLQIKKIIQRMNIEEYIDLNNEKYFFIIPFFLSIMHNSDSDNKEYKINDIKNIMYHVGDYFNIHMDLSDKIVDAIFKK